MARDSGPFAAPAQIRRARLRKPDFVRVTQAGRRRGSRFFLVYGLDRGDLDPARLGITVTRKVGNAVRRNRIKRLVREWFRQRSESMTGLDVVVIAKRDFPHKLGQSEVAADLNEALGPDCSRLLQ